MKQRSSVRNKGWLRRLIWSPWVPSWRIPEDANHRRSIWFRAMRQFLNPAVVRERPPQVLTKSSAQLGLRWRTETAFGLDKADDAIEAYALPQIGHDEWAFATHPSRVGIHFFQRCADMRREVDLVDNEKVRPGDAGAALRGDLVAGGDVDHVDREIGEFGRECSCEIVAAGFDQHQIEIGKFRAHVGDRGEIHRGVLADRGMRTAAGLNSGDAIRRQRPRAHQEFGIPFGVDVVGDRGDVVPLPQGRAEQIYERGFARSDGTTDADAKRTVRTGHVKYSPGYRRPCERRDP